MSLLRRLANLEHQARARGGVRCTKCAGLPNYAVDWPEIAASTPVTCSRCGWQQGQIIVEYVEALAS
jgi:hypothetical protein